MQHVKFEALMAKIKREIDKPFLDIDDAFNIFHRLYGRKPSSVESLDGYNAANFFIKVPKLTDHIVDGHNIEDQHEKFVMRVLSSEESKNEEYFCTVHSVQRYLCQRGFICATPIRNTFGDDLAIEEFTKDDTDDPNSNVQLHGRYMVRAYPYIDGIILRDVLPLNNMRIIYEAGKVLAEMHKILKTYSEDMRLLKEKSDTWYWSLEQAAAISLKYTYLLEGNNRKDLIFDIVRTFKNRVLERKDQFRKGIIHSDFSDTNLIATLDDSIGSRGDRKQPGKAMPYKLSAVIDFENMEYNCLIFDVGIAMMYITYSKAARNHPLRASAAFLAGYQHVNPLTPVELEVLHVCQAARFVQSLLIGLHTCNVQPGNEYILQSQTGWPVLEALWGMEAEEIRQMRQNVAEECAQANPHRVFVSGYIQQNLKGLENLIYHDDRFLLSLVMYLV